MDENKILPYRLSAIGVLLIPFALSMVFAVDSILNFTSNEYVLNIISLFIIIIFLVSEIALLLKNRKKDLFFNPIAFDEYYKINKVAIYAINVFAVIGTALLVIGIVSMCQNVTYNPSSDFYAKAFGHVFFVAEEYDKFMSSEILTVVGTVILTNCVLYDVYVLLTRQKKFNKADLIK